MSTILLKCRKCRGRLNEDNIDCVVSSHSVPLNTTTIKYNEGKCSMAMSEVFYIRDTSMPKWIAGSVDMANWCKGKLICPHCTARLGSFDFVAGMKCPCDNFILPPVHLVKSKVDYNVI